MAVFYSPSGTEMLLAEAAPGRTGKNFRKQNDLGYITVCRKGDGRYRQQGWIHKLFEQIPVRLCAI
jgi:hypothetical protein